ncbi:shufflon system plasmid conjugative transfer pilus tip adhesin PilV [Aquimarina sp. 2201CG5-10]|uniref:shufflon system plasmid conjugative transfer pilus tip adhesin PilV n=1 Tax=Aquimarina callyspongiae TaxID=3098150 RepID=UPI002AB38204|nr:shufflon system plasmid conjugative transfer pilus tip adhesin PilV [Aquimarina sp. 2201CG5-10]MDY8136196.1 shufflon system plasmid conjugative transfer pilus tip adhesin PilV [Aquimarina sp. 2201CG5-10]
MKNIFTIIIVLFITFSGIQIHAQNTFPSNGNVGIGTTSPKQKLHVHSINPASFTLLSGTAPGILFSPTSTASFGVAAIGLSTSSAHYHSSSSSGDFNIRSAGGRDIVIGTLASSNSTNGTERMRIKNNGNVGIGTSNPVYKFQAQGDIYANGGWLRASGNNGILFQSHGGGFRMTDGNWIRTYGNKNFYHNTGVMRTDGQLQVGPAGNRFIVNQNGNVGIGTGADTSNYKLAVKGKVLAEELKIRTYANWPDYVFNHNYKLKTLQEVENHINTNGHLPNIPSAKEIKDNGISVGEMNAKLLEKIEELTLYLIKQQKDIESLKKSNLSLMNSIKTGN